MTTEFEQEFFNVFGIEPIPIKSYGYWLIKGSIAENDKGEKVVYPEITDRKLLEMICILNSTNGINFTAYESKNISDLKKEILNECMDISDEKELKAKIQQLFKVKE